MVHPCSVLFHMMGCFGLLISLRDRKHRQRKRRGDDHGGDNMQ
jgi:hypothetical protein